MIEELFFWLDGVVTDSLAETAIRQVEDAIGATLDTHIRVAIRDWALDLQLGRLDGLTFCREALSLAHASLDEKELAARIQSNVTPIPGMVEVLQELEGKYNLWLIANCPRDWLLPNARLVHLPRLFPEDSILICPELALPRLIPDIFYLAAHRAGKSIENCLLVAADSAITTAAVKIGLNAIIFADASRLRRELGLRRLLSPLQGR